MSTTCRPKCTAIRPAFVKVAARHYDRRARYVTTTLAGHISRALLRLVNCSRGHASRDVPLARPLNKSHSERAVHAHESQLISNCVRAPCVSMFEPRRSAYEQIQNFGLARKKRRHSVADKYLPRSLATLSRRKRQKLCSQRPESVCAKNIVNFYDLIERAKEQSGDFTGTRRGDVFVRKSLLRSKCATCRLLNVPSLAHRSHPHLHFTFAHDDYAFMAPKNTNLECEHLCARTVRTFEPFSTVCLAACSNSLAN